MKLQMKYNTEDTGQPVCPYCGHVFREPEILPFDDNWNAEEECPECGRTIRITRFVSVSYSTYKAGGTHV